MKYSFRGIATLLGGTVFVAWACFTGPNCSPTGGDLGGSAGNVNNDGGRSGQGGGGSGGSANGGAGGSNSAGGASSAGGSGSGGKASGGSSGTGGKGSGGAAAGGSSSGGSNAGGSVGGSAGSNAGGSSPGGTGGSTSTTSGATCTTDLMTLRTGADNNWIPSTVPSCGVQGALYAYGDGSTCTSPSPISSAACVSGTTGCCISGATVLDTTSAKWGCGLGLDLNATAGTPSTKKAYAGAAKGFKITLTGTVATGQKIRIMYSSGATEPASGTSPYKEVTGVGTYSVLFSDATCPTWATGDKCAVVSGSAAYAIKVQIPGGSATGDAVGAFKDVCITSITPIP